MADRDDQHWKDLDRDLRLGIGFSALAMEQTADDIAYLRAERDKLRAMVAKTPEPSRIEELRAENERWSDRIDELTAERDALREYVTEQSTWPCTCDPAFYERRRSAPDCMADLVGDEARELLGMPVQCKGRIARTTLRELEEDNE